MDNELRRRLDEISSKVDNLAGDSKAKKKSPIWKRISITIPIVVAIIGLIGTAYELGLLFFENQSNRQTIEFYTSFAKSLVENGDYETAQRFLQKAEEIDANNSEIVVTKAFIDMMNLIRRDLIENRDTFSESSYYLSQLSLEPAEIQYHMGIVAAKAGVLDIAEEYLRSIPPEPNRFSLLARSKLIGEVYLNSINKGGGELNRSVSQILTDAQTTLIEFVRDVQRFDDDQDLSRRFTDQLYAYGFALIFRLPAEYLPEIYEAYKMVEPVNDEFLVTLQHQLDIFERGEEPELENEEKVLENLYAAKEKSGKYSQATEQINDFIMQYSAQIQLEELESEAESDLSRIESILKQGIQKRRSREFEEANTIFLNIIQDYNNNNRKADEILYKTYFNLALLNEYNLYRIDEAIKFYNKAEELEKFLNLNDPSIHNTFGYLYYKKGRDAYKSEEKIKYLALAEKKLLTALEIDPGYSKSLNTLDGVQIERQKLERQQNAQQQVIQMTNRR